MNFKHILSVTAVTLALVPSAHAYEGQQPLTVTTTLLNPNGKPATDATVIEDVVDYFTREITTTSYSPDSKGNVTFKVDPNVSADGGLVIYAISPTGIGFLSWGDQFTPAISTLEAFSSVRIHLVDSSGNPVAHARVSPSGFNILMDNVYNIWDDSIPGPWSSTTDNNGYATLSELPRGVKFQLSVHDDDFTLPHGDTNIQLSNAASSPDVTVQLNPAGSISGTVVFGTTGKPVPGIQVVASGGTYYSHLQPVLTDKDGNFTLAGLNDDTYRVGVYRKRKNFNDYVAVPQSVVLSPAEHIKNVNFALIHGVVISGKVTDILTGKPVSDIAVDAETLQDSPKLRGSTEAQTGPDGIYTLRVVPGKTAITAYPSIAKAGIRVQTLDTVDGDMKSIDIQVTAPIRPTVVHGIVLAPNGKPAAGSIVIGYDEDETPQEATADAQGHFTLDGPGLEPNGKILARFDGQCTQDAFTYTPDTPVILQLATTGVSTLRGQINDSDGNPVANANVLLTLNISDKSGITIEHAYSNAQGLYAFAPTFGNVKYIVSASTPGHAPAKSDPALATAGQAMDLPTLVAITADAILGGTVVDSKGNPVANVEVSDDVMIAAQATTDKAGHFVLTGTPRGKTNVYAMAPDGTYGYGPAISGRGDNVIYLQKAP